MTPLQMAREECANLNDDGSCMGMEFNDRLQPVRCTPRDKCVLAERGARCRYFEESVLPMHTDQKWGSLRLAGWADGVRQYQSAAMVTAEQRGLRVCPVCKERELEPRKQRCYICADKAAKASAATRLAKHRKRGLDATDLPKSAIVAQ